MEKYTLAVMIKDGKKNSYRKKLGEIWPELTAFLDRNQIHNFSIWSAEMLIFVYCECDKKILLSQEEEKVKEFLISRMSDTFTWISDPEKNMRLMYHNLGIIRESKELIRHRVFMAKLKLGCEEEYKLRHDVLSAKHGNKLNPGPDSNFSIWSAGGYIFGYDEIDTTMELEETAESRRETIVWETRQLEIMDWVTDDVDWITGEHHVRSVRLAWHL